MKLGTTRSVMLAIAVLGFLAAAPMTYAGVITNHSGAICTNFSAGDVTLIDHPALATRSVKTSQTYITCPLTRNTSNSGGASVYVDVLHYGTQTTTCTAYSYDDRYNILEVKTGEPATGSGVWEVTMSLSRSTPWSDYSVVCNIPGNGNGLVFGVDLLEN